MWYDFPVTTPFRAQDEAPPRQRCAKRRCPKPARAGGSRRGALCTEHHAAAMRAWRDRRRKAGKSVAGASRTASSSSADAARTRKALERAKSRGDLAEGPCAVCGGRQGVVATRPDASDPTAITWAHRGCRYSIVRVFVEKHDEKERETALAIERAAFAKLCAQIVTLVAALPEDVAKMLQDDASRGGPLGRLRPESPLYLQRLARAYALYTTH